MKDLKNKGLFSNLLLIGLKIHLGIVKNLLQDNHTVMYFFSKTKKRGSKSSKSFLSFVTRNTLRERPLMAYNFRVGRVVLNDPLKLVVID